MSPTATIAAPTLATTHRAAEYIAAPLARTIGYAEKLVADIPADKFGHMPHPNFNHPAFIIGHLSLYPTRIFTMLGRTELIVEQQGWPELFQAGVACVEDDGRYPRKDDLVAHFLLGHRKMLEILPTITDEALARPNPLEGRMREIFPLVGIAVNFLCNNLQHGAPGPIERLEAGNGLAAGHVDIEVPVLTDATSGRLIRWNEIGRDRYDHVAFEPSSFADSWRRRTGGSSTTQAPHIADTTLIWPLIRINRT